MLAMFYCCRKQNHRMKIFRVRLFFHLVGISFWIGSLLPLLHLSLSSNTANLYLIAHRFGILAVYYVSGLLVAGAGFTYALLGSDLSLLLSTSYGNVLLAKLATSVLFYSSEHSTNFGVYQKSLKMVQEEPGFLGSVSYTHLTLPTILPV